MDAQTLFPQEETAAEAQQEIREEFGFLADWAERYQYVIDLGRRLPPMKAEWQVEENRLVGCQSRVWIVAEVVGDKLVFHGLSDSAIVSGLVYLALRVYSHRSPQEILDTEAAYVDSIGLSQHLSPTRNNGLAALLAFIRLAAERVTRGEAPGKPPR